jgi:hypothetical protein
MKGNTWFRLYNDVINDPKVQLLPKALRWAWIELLCLASKHDGVLPPVEQIAFAVRSSVNDAQADLDALIFAELIDIAPDGRLTPHNWSERQFASDSSRERTKNYRERLKKRFGDGDVTSQVTTQDPDPETERDNNYPSTVDRASSGSKINSISLGVGRGGAVSPEARRRAAAALGVASVDPLVARYEAWPKSRNARDPDALFIRSAATIFRNAPDDVKAACRPIADPVEPIRHAQASSQLIATLSKGKRHGVRSY